MNGMLLAAGRGERMEPLSSLVAKPALEVCGRPLLASALDHLREAGCRRVVVNLHRHPEQVRRAALSVWPQCAFSHEPELLGSAGGIAAARRLFGAGPVLVANGDLVADLDLGVLPEAGGPEVAVLALLPHPDRARWSSVRVSGDGTVTGILPRGASAGYLYTGFQLLGEKVVEDLPFPPAQMRGVWDRLMAEGRLRGVVVSGRWREAGSPAEYRELAVDVAGRRGWIDPEAQVEQGTEVVSSALGRDCRVGGGSTVEGSVLTAGAAIGRDCRLKDCVVAGTAVADGTILEAMVVVPAGARPLRP